MAAMVYQVACAAAAVLLAASVPLLLSPIQPLSYSAPASPPFIPPFPLNTRLQSLDKLYQGQVQGPEDVLTDEQGNLFCSNSDGIIRKLWRNGSVSVWARTGGRPLGIEWVHPGRVMAVCEPTQGLLLASEGTYKVVSETSETDNLRLRFPNNVDVASNGSIYFSDVSHKYGFYNQSYELLEARPNGRLLRFDPETGRTETVLRDLHFPNGVALSPQEDFLLVAECTRHRIRRYYLQGPAKGTVDTFIANLPGMPDNINLDNHGLFWVALFMPRQPPLDWIQRHPLLKRVLAHLPSWTWQTSFRHAGMLLALNNSGDVVHFWMDPEGKAAQKVTTARRFQDMLYLGFIEGDFLGTLPMPVDSKV